MLHLHSSKRQTSLLQTRETNQATVTTKDTIVLLVIRMKYLPVFLFLTLCSQSFTLDCRWLDQKFKETNAISLGLLHILGGDITVEMRNIPAFPEALYTQSSNSAGDDKAWFILQVLEEIMELFNEDLDSVTWEEIRLEHFLSVLDTQKEGLKSCIVTKKKKSKKLHMYFKRLENQILKEMEYSAEAWEQIRNVVRRHLYRLDVI